MPGDEARRRVAATRFADIRWTAETGSTNTDALELARAGEPEGVVVVADHQTGGRGRLGRVWQAPPGASLLVSVLLRPPAEVAGLVTAVTALAAAEAVEAVTGVRAALKWPNDLVVDGEGDGPPRKLAGVLAEADWPSRSAISAGWSPPPPGERVVVVAGIGINVNWPPSLPDELAGIAVACNHLTGSDVDREALLADFLARLDDRYGALVAGGSSAVVADWRAQCATIGRRVRVDLGATDVEGVADDITADGHLVVVTDSGERHELAAGDVVHLRAAGGS